MVFPRPLCFHILTSSSFCSHPLSLEEGHGLCSTIEQPTIAPNQCSCLLADLFRIKETLAKRNIFELFISSFLVLVLVLAISFQFLHFFLVTNSSFSYASLCFWSSAWLAQRIKYFLHFLFCLKIRHLWSTFYTYF